MKYSVIVPHYNDTARLERLLRTVPLGRDDLEVIVVDDCTPRLPLAELRARWPSVSWLSTERNSGAGAARNIGLKYARGERVIFADSDDEFTDGAFQAFDKHIRKDDELVYFLAEGVQEVDGTPSNRVERMNQLCEAYLDNPSNRNFTRLKLGHVSPVAKVYALEFIRANEIWYDESRVGNDVAFNVVAAVSAKQLRVVPIPVYRVYRRRGSLTASEDLQTVLMRLRALASINMRLAKMGYAERLHAGGFLYRAFCKGPRFFLSVLNVANEEKLLWPTLRRLSLLDMVRFAARARRDSIERNRITNKTDD